MATGNASVTGSIQRVLLLGPDDEARRALHLMLDRIGKQVAALADPGHLARYLADHECDAIIAAAEIAVTIANTDRAVIAVVRSRDVGAALSLLEAGADEVVCEPLDELAVTLALRRVAARERRPRSGKPNGTATLVGDSAAMQQLRATIQQIASAKTTVLVLGESGTGKELVARALHDSSPRVARRFVAVNCAAIPAPLLESELFGHVRGAFTDAVRDKIGLFEEADGGTLFLDEVGEMPLALQAKLLRALQEGEIRKVGENQPIQVDVRLVAATLRDLREDVAAGRFREDLFYRLNVLPIEIPPLRARTDDIPVLARAFAKRHAERHGRQAIELPADVLDALCDQPWPGNVRELENVIERALVLSDAPLIDLEFLGSVMQVRPAATAPASAAPPMTVPDGELSIKKATCDLERQLITRALGVTGGNRTNAAKLLEISHRALLYKMKEYGIS